MAKNIDRLASGQAPSLLNASKGNELIDAINNLRNSKSSTSAETAGIILRVSGEGGLELDVTSDFLELLNPQNDVEENEEPSGIPEGYEEVVLIVTRNGLADAMTFLIKN